MNNNIIYDIDLNNIPTHIAIIMDGNEDGQKLDFFQELQDIRLSRNYKRYSKECSKLGVKHLTLYAFSTENWKRPKLKLTHL